MDGPLDGCAYLFLKRIFDSGRIGFYEIALKILEYLDYDSFVSLKRSNKLVYSFVSDHPYIEKRKEKLKLHRDWKFGTPQRITVDVPDLVACGRIFGGRRKVLVGLNRTFQIFDTFKRRSLLVVDHPSRINCIELEENKGIIATGSIEGQLALWDAESGQKLVEKQLFGRIEAIKWIGDKFVTAHFGKGHDAGCITIRQYNSPKDFPVIHSKYEDLLPIFSLDICDEFLAALEWSGTYNNVHGGNVLLFDTKNLTYTGNLSEYTKCYNYTCCRFAGNLLLTGGHDQEISIWKIEAHGVFKLLQTLKGHEGIIVKMELEQTFKRLVSRDISGLIILWDLSEYDQSEKSLQNIPSCHLKTLESESRMITCIGIDKTRLLLGSIGSFYILDFWNSATSC